MGWSIVFECTKALSEAYRFCASHPEAVSLGGLMLFLILRHKLKAALILAFAVTLCFGNYFMFSEHHALALPIIYSAGLAGASIFLLLLLVYQFIDSV